MSKPLFAKLVGAVMGLLLLFALLYRLPAVHDRLSWRLDFASTYLRGVLNPAGPLPTALPQPQIRITQFSDPADLPEAETRAAGVPGPTPSITPTLRPSPTPTPPPQSASLTAPAWEKQDINNCGPATLTMLLRYYGWSGAQENVATELKPFREDRNVNVEELEYYVRNHAGWLSVAYRVGGNLETLKRLLAAGFPVVIEESFFFEETYWPNDDQWAAHYNLLTGYDDGTQTFTVQDSFYGANLSVAYEKLDEYWQSFNRVYFVVYPPEQEPLLQSILGADWDVDQNRRRAQETALAETEADPENAFAWFNLGTNLVFFEDYSGAARAYDTARNLGLPQRMLRYQFGPFFAYFHTHRTEDLLALTDYALQRTPNSEEAMLWKGWGLFRQGKTNQAAEEFRSALKANPNYLDARYALDYLSSQK